MAENSGFFNANLVNGTYDRVYLAEQFAKYFASFVGNGVFGGKLNELMVTQAASSGMKIEVLSGMGWINGYWYENTSNLSLNIDVADGVFNRIDCVVLRWNKSDRRMNVVIKKGTFASSPVAPTLQRDADIYELKLAEISVNAGTTDIAQANIKDTRSDSNVCGLVTGLIKQIDYNEFSNLLKSSLDKLEAKTKDMITSMINRLSDIVGDENAFANLSLEVSNIANEVALSKQTIGYTKKNLIPYPFAQTTRTSGGITWTDNGDGTITANGTATENAYFNLYRGKAFGIGKFLVNAGIDTQTKYFAYIRFIDRGTSLEVPDTTILGFEDIPIEITETDAKSYDLFVGITVLKGTTVSNLTFKPMVRRAEVIDGVWEPYKLSIDEMIQEDEIEKGCFYRMNRFTKVKEWLNPPSKYGVEYCTTERWENKPVYQKTFHLSTLPNKNVASFATGTTWDKVISVSAYALDSDDLTYYPFPVILHNQFTPIAIISRVESDGYLAIATTEDASYLKAYVTVKYVK